MPNKGVLAGSIFISVSFEFRATPCRLVRKLGRNQECKCFPALSLCGTSEEVLVPNSYGICRSRIHHHEFQEVKKRGRKGRQPIPHEVHGVLLFLFHCPESSQMVGGIMEQNLHSTLLRKKQCCPN